MLKQVAHLTNNQSMCSSDGYDILKDNLEYSKGLPYLVKLIRGFIVKNGEYCGPIFAGLAKRLRDDNIDSYGFRSFMKLTSNLAEQVSGMSVDRLETFLEEAIEKNSINLRDYIKETFGTRKNSVDLKDLMHRTALEADPFEPNYKNYIANYHARDQWTTLPDEFLRTIVRYQIKPCGDFVQAMDRRRVFQMASLQSKVLQRNFSFVPHDDGQDKTRVQDLVAFYKTWIRYESCKTYILAYDIYEQVKEARKMLLGSGEDAHYHKPVEVQFPDPTIVKLDELIE